MKKNTDYIGVEDKYIPEEEKYVDDSVLGDKEKTRKTIKKFGIGYLCFFLMFFALIIGFIIFQFTNIMKVQKNFGSFASSFNKTSINAQFEQYQGTTTFTKSALDKIVTNNKKYPDHKITVVYNGKTAVEEDDIVEIKYSLTETKYEVSLDYDKDGCVNKFTIKDIPKN